MRYRCLLVLLCLEMSWLNTPGVALDCSDSNLVHKTNCDECIRCGGIWCKDGNEPVKCAGVTNGRDSWCPDDRVKYEEVESDPQEGLVFDPQYDDKLTEINAEKYTVLNIKYSSSQSVQSVDKARVEVLNTTQPSGKSKVHVDIAKKSSEELYVITKVQAGFCSPTSQLFEYVFVGVRMAGVQEMAVLKYHVQCRCGCSAERWAAAPACHGHGSLVCGTCQCDPDRLGKFCECGKPSSSCIDGSTEKCSGNGRCDAHCNVCQCDERVTILDTEHFDSGDNCKDIISSKVTNFLDCLKNKEVPCGDCDYDIIFQKWDGALVMNERDGDRKLWVNLKGDLSPYWATRKDGKIYVMRKPAPQCL